MQAIARLVPSERSFRPLPNKAFNQEAYWDAGLKELGDFGLRAEFKRPKVKRPKAFAYKLRIQGSGIDAILFESLVNIHTSKNYYTAWGYRIQNLEFRTGKLAMSQQDNFFGGFLVGALVGGVVGGVLGTLVAPRLSKQDTLESEKKFSRLDGKKGDKRQLPTEQSIEASRRGLEDKIAQLNDAIDDVRLKLGGINGGSRLDPIEKVKGDG